MLFGQPRDRQCGQRQDQGQEDEDAHRSTLRIVSFIEEGAQELFVV